jgi:2-hydroxy-6-oxonona-2,4-dienedioate hydrolase
MHIYKEPLYSQAYVNVGQGHPVILLHGLFGNLAMWRPTISALRHTHRVIVPRLPLFELPIHRANINYLVEVLHEFLNWHQLDPVTLVGTDIGGQLALEYANRFPEQVKRVIISGSSGLFENLPALDKDEREDYDNVKDYVRSAFYKHEIVKDAIVDKVYRTVNTSAKNLQISAFVKASQKNRMSHFLYRLNKPVLIVWGLQDKITPPEVALHFHDLLPNGRVKFIDECGHLPMVEKPFDYNQALLNFLNGSEIN